MMRRPAGVTIAAVAVFVGSALTLLSAALMIFAFAVMPATESTPAFTRSAGLIMSIFMLGFAAWGIVTGINLLQLREWSRISMIVFSGLLLVMAVPGLLMMLVMPLPTPPVSAVPPGEAIPPLAHLMTAVRIGMAIFYALLALLGAWWIYFFNSRPIREIFRGAAGTPSSNWTPAMLAPAEVPGAPKRPVSITIIAYLALVGACMFPVLNILHLPLTFLGFFFTGGKASLIVIGYMSVQLLMAYGLLKLEMWGRSLAIYYFNFAIFNSIISVILPGAQARYEEAMTAMQGSLGLPPTQFQFPLWFSLVFSLPWIGIQLWFVVARKKAFEDPHGPLAPR
jgi:ABC-type antimicrobial peptide transport system permease subunit